MNEKDREGSVGAISEHAVKDLEGDRQKAAPSKADARGQMPDSRNQRAHQKAITQGLRTFFDAVASEPVPDEFFELLKKMDDRKKDPDA